MDNLRQDEVSDEPVSPFRDVWTALGRLRERVEELDDEQAREQGRQLAEAIYRAETEWAVMRRGQGVN